ncbi:hypothetical protein [Promicromonospora sp. NPDC050262]|uniref:hypothetical protein n=1 Tax=Promicromonospora sp. NPDC050262 TaxID=3155036 RepID=UPI0033CEB742
MTAYVPGRSALSRQQAARARRYVAVYAERFGRIPREVPTTVYVEDTPDREELT